MIASKQPNGSTFLLPEAPTKKIPRVVTRKPTASPVYAGRSWKGGATGWGSGGFEKENAVANDVTSATTCLSHMKKIFLRFRRWELNSRKGDWLFGKILLSGN